jgi:hypothetical protein
LPAGQRNSNIGVRPITRVVKILYV